MTRSLAKCVLLVNSTHMKERLTVTLDPTVVRKAKALAVSRETNFSALIESLLRKDIENSRRSKGLFTDKWLGKLSLKTAAEGDLRAKALVEKYESLGKSAQKNRCDFRKAKVKALIPSDFLKLVAI
jgi:hypothetical protein